MDGMHFESDLCFRLSTPVPLIRTRFQLVVEELPPLQLDQRSTVPIAPYLRRLDTLVDRGTRLIECAVLHLQPAFVVQQILGPELGRDLDRWLTRTRDVVLGLSGTLHRYSSLSPGQVGMGGAPIAPLVDAIRTRLEEIVPRYRETAQLLEMYLRQHVQPDFQFPSGLFLPRLPRPTGVYALPGPREGIRLVDMLPKQEPLPTNARAAVVQERLAYFRHQGRMQKTAQIHILPPSSLDDVAYPSTTI